MKQLIFSTIFLLGLVASLSSCEQCKQCSAQAEVKTYLADSLISTVTQAVSAQEFCDDQLDMIEDNPTVTTETTQQVGSISQRIETATTYTCN